jgi:hypothetical protein
VTGANILSPLRGGIIGLGKSYRKACGITPTAGKATGQLYPREEENGRDHDAFFDFFSRK